jgi:hypothetical protein
MGGVKWGQNPEYRAAKAALIAAMLEARFSDTIECELEAASEYAYWRARVANDRAIVARELAWFRFQAKEANK